MKKISFLNIVTVILVIIIAVSSVMFLGNSREWFSKAKKEDEFSVTAPVVEGSVSVIRRGAGYSLKEGIGLVAGDEVLTSAGASAVIELKKAGNVFMDEDSGMALSCSSEESQDIYAESGCLYIQAIPSDLSLVVKTAWGTARADEESVFSVEMRHGTQTLRVYKGEVKVLAAGSETAEIVASGQQLVVIQDEDGKSSVLEQVSISPKNMSDFLLAKTIEEGEGLCFESGELKGESDRRIKEVEDARLAREQYEKEIIARGGTVPVVVVPQSSSSPGNYSMSCTITIRCDTILSNMDKLSPGKEAFVPANGVILVSTRVQFTEGETVFDVLKRVCSYAGLNLNYSYTVAYGGYYVEGINNIGEFDCGPESGWMYEVNGWFPNYGSYHYVLKDGDDIVWGYTCTGLGADLGAVYGE